MDRAFVSPPDDRLRTAIGKPEGLVIVSPVKAPGINTVALAHAALVGRLGQPRLQPGDRPVVLSVNQDRHVACFAPPPVLRSIRPDIAENP